MPHIIPFNIMMDARRAEELIRQIAADSSAVAFTVHAEARMEERDISLADVLRVLKQGFVEDPPRMGASAGEWKVKIVRHQR